MKSSRRKLGLALSGGGFRASFFHIGVLARLAELDLLRSVEVLSCVSGGSILGAAYYLRLKALLESRPDRKIGREDYMDLVRTLESEFLDGVQTNVRTRAFSNFQKNWKMFRKSYSRSDRLAELYDETFYAPIAGHRNVLMSELKIQPPQAPRPFYPRTHNRTRHAKVPMLILNATSLNSGKNWQFTAVDMGEREPEKEFLPFERGWTLAPLRYDAREVPHEKYRRVPLGIAVASSACVPGLFHPLPMTDLYPGVVPELVDGGVHDNQGLSAILFEGCTDIVISDASEQLSEVRLPGTGIMSVVSRANGILMGRVRDQGLESLRLRGKTKDVLSSTLVHLREGIEEYRTQPGEEQAEKPDLRRDTGCGINPSVQRLLAVLRTDLDSFSDTEAQSLMLSGYNISRHVVGQEVPRIFAPRAGRSPKKEAAGRSWKFSAMEDRAGSERPDPDYIRQLRVGGNTFFKAYRLMPRLIPLGVAILILSLIVPASLVLLFLHFVLDASVASAGWYALGVTALLGVLALLGLPFARQMWSHNLLRFAANLAIASCGSLLAYLHLRWIDPQFLRRGKAVLRRAQV